MFFSGIYFMRVNYELYAFYFNKYIIKTLLFGFFGCLNVIYRTILSPMKADFIGKVIFSST